MLFLKDKQEEKLSQHASRIDDLLALVNESVFLAPHYFFQRYYTARVYQHAAPFCIKQKRRNATEVKYTIRFTQKELDEIHPMIRKMWDYSYFSSYAKLYQMEIFLQHAENPGKLVHCKDGKDYYIVHINEILKLSNCGSIVSFHGEGYVITDKKVLRKGPTQLWAQKEDLYEDIIAQDLNALQPDFSARLKEGVALKNALELSTQEISSYVLKNGEEAPQLQKEGIQNLTVLF